MMQPEANKFHRGAKDGKHYWLTPPDLYRQLDLLKAGATIRNLGDVKWLATEDGTPGKGTGRHISCFVLEPPKREPANAEVSRSHE